MPSSIVSPGLSDCGPCDAAAVDLDAVGRAEVLDDPRAAARAAPRRGGGRRSGRESTTSQSRERPITPPPEAEHAGACPRSAAARCRGGGRARAAAPRAARTPCRPSCGPRRPGSAPATRPRPGRTSRAWMPNSPEPQPVVGAERDLRRGDQRDPLAAGVLEQVARQLRGEVVARSPRTACGRRARARRRTRWARTSRDSDWTLCSSISRVSLRAISTGRTSDLKARENVPSTRPASLDSRLRRTLIAGRSAGYPFAPRSWVHDIPREQAGHAATRARRPRSRRRRGRAAARRPAHSATAAVPEPSPAAHALAPTKSTPA